jgi:alkylation response protein AidB-like acyl-CoA dehydrogenase
LTYGFQLATRYAGYQLFRKEVRDWLAENMRSEHLRWSGIWSTREMMRVKFRRQLTKLGKRGWLFPTYPVKYGGTGLSLRPSVCLETEIDRYGLPLGSVFTRWLGWSLPRC